MKVGIAGSFDPVTKKHVNLFTEAASLFNKVVILVATNTDKKPYFSLEQRLRMLNKAILGLPNISIEQLPQEYVARYCLSHDIPLLIRGVRNAQDLEYEQIVATLNRKINPTLKTLLWSPLEYTKHISSSLIKSLVGFPHWQRAIEGLVPEGVMEEFVRSLYGEKMKAHWVKELGSSPYSMKSFEKCFNLLCESHRYYHNPQHILELLELIDQAQIQYKLSGEESFILKMAAWFHDIIYDPKQKNNELQSSIFWEEFYKNGEHLHHFSPTVLPKVREIILATQNHTKVAKGDKLMDIFLDVDLAILGASPERFQEYDDQIQREYSFIPPEHYFMARRKILQEFFNSPHLFRSFGKVFEKQAKNNLMKVTQN